MRLTCPNCAADYDVPDGMVPAAGRHVQCTVCHTRWFVSGAPRAALSEDQILDRLETRATRPRPVVVAAAEPEAETPAVAEEVPPEIELPEPEPLVPDAAPAPLPEGPTPPRRPEFAKPADRPTVERPAALGDLPPPPRSALRLELVDDLVRAPVEPPARSRFGVGLLVVLLVAVIAFGTYLYRVPIAAAVPAAAPALAAYGTEVDVLRSGVEARLVPLRRAVENARN